MSKANRMNKNDEAVSPIVATLVLIVVAIVGAAAVGVLMGAFQNNVGKQMTNSNAGTAASAKISIAGSSSCLPVAQAIANQYMAANPSIQITVAGGGSGVGIASAGQGLTDIGTVSEPLTATQLKAYPALKANEIGKGCVVVVAGSGFLNTTITKSDLMALYDHGTHGYTSTLNDSTIADGIEVVYRSDNSGTQGVFGNWLYGTGYNTYLNEATGAPDNHAIGGINTKVSGQSSGGNVITEIGKTPNSIGFADFDAACNAPVGTAIAPKVQILSIKDGSTAYGLSVAKGGDAKSLRADMLDAMKGVNSTGYVSGLIRPLNFVTNGAPSPIEQSLIDFARDPSMVSQYQAVNVFHPVEYGALA